VPWLLLFFRTFSQVFGGLLATFWRTFFLARFLLSFSRVFLSTSVLHFLMSFVSRFLSTSVLCRVLSKLYFRPFFDLFLIKIKE